MDISGYKILREIGRGGMSSVYLAVQESLDRPVALKVMAHGLAGNQGFKDRFLKEGRIVAHLNHRNIVTIHDIGFADGVYFIAMEYVVGRNLSERIQEGLTPKQCINIVKRVARALSHAHERGFIHRDIKPSNVLFRDDRDAVLADFGIAKSLQEDKGLTVTGLTPGTPNYMSPEQLRGRLLDGRSDLYSLGVVLYEMLTRERPFDAGTGIATALRHLNEPPPELPDQFSSLRPIMAQLLAKEPEDRFRNAAELIKALDRTRVSRSTTPALDALKTAFEPEIPLEPKAPTTPEAGPTTFEPAPTRLEKATMIEPAATTTIEPATTLEPAVEDVETALPPGATVAGRGITGATATKKLRKTPMVWGVTAVIAIVLLITLLSIREFRNNEQEQLAIKQLLIQGKGQLAAARFYAPNGDNALETYQQVLDIESNHAAALVGMARVADEAERDAREARQAGALSRGLTAVEQGLRAEPGHEGLLDLRNDVATAIAQERQQRRIEVLLAQAEQGIEQGRFTQPPGNNAYGALAAVLKMAPRNEKALAGMERITTRLQELASERQTEGQLQTGLALIDEGLTVNPEHEGLLALRAEIRGQISDEQEGQRIAAALDQAKAQFEAGRRIEPRGDNALETYQSILSIDRDNQQAQTGIAEIVKHLEERARATLQSGKYEQALVQMDRAMQALPEQAGVRALHAEITSVQEAHRRDIRIATLVKRAEQQVADGRYLSPADSNLLRTYEAIRALDPANTEINQSLQNAAAHFLAQAHEAENSEQATRALTAISDGLRFVANDPGLLALQAEIHQQQEADLERERRLKELLASAEARMAAGRLMVPEGDNAYEAYQEVLRRDPQNRTALSGMAELAKLMHQRAQEMYEQDALEEGLAVVRLGLQAAPRHTELLVLESKITQRLRANVESERVAQLLAQAERQLADLKLTVPAGDNALESYRKVLSLEPNSGQAKNGLREISNRYVELAQTKRADGDLEGALAMAERGLTIEPEHRRLQSLTDAIGRRLDELSAHERELTQLLAKAQREFEAGRLTRPESNNAFEAFQAVLEIDPGNRRAQAGVQAIADRYGALARAKRDEGDLEEGLSLVALGLKVDPNHSGLNTLGAEIQDTLQAQADREQALDALYTQAQQQLERQHLAQPAGDNAYETIQAILQADPGNTRAEQMLDELLTRYESLARARQRNGALKDSLTLTEEALEIKPDHAGLVALQRSLTREIEAVRQAELEAQARPAVETADQPALESIEEPEEDNRPARTFGTF